MKRTSLVIALLSIASLSSAEWTVVNLHPVGAVESFAYGVSGTQQVGSAKVGGVERASLWSGTAASWVDLSPAGATFSIATDVSASKQVGLVSFGGATRGSLWSGSAASWVDVTPSGASGSGIFAISGDQQVGRATFGDNQASLWSGTAASWTNLQPAGVVESQAWGVHGASQVGIARLTSDAIFRATLWFGSPASSVDLHPPGATGSSAIDVYGTKQTGTVSFGETSRASLWTGSAASWVDLTPLGATRSRASGMNDTYQVGSVDGRASLWSGTAASWVDLHQFLSGSWSGSEARAIWTDGTTTYVAGYGFSLERNRHEALLWVRNDTVLSGFTITRGQLLAGNLASLGNDDGNRLLIISDENEPEATVEVFATASTATPTFVRVDIEHISVRDDQSVFLRLKDHTTGQFPLVGFDLSSLTDKMLLGVGTGTLSRFVHPTSREVRARVSFIPSQDLDAGDGWSSGLDRVTFTVY